MKFKTDSYQAWMHVYLARTCKEMHMNPDVFGLSNTGHLRRNAVLHPGDDMVIMWWACHLITQWGVGLNTSDLTQRSSLVTRVASDLGRACQKYLCTVWSIIGLRYSPPRLKNQHGLNEEKTLKEKNDLSIESSEVNVWLDRILPL